jgi:hypothetical protein
MDNFASALKQLQLEHSRVAPHLESLSQAISALSALSIKPRACGRTLSAASRARIVAAQRARWAKVKGQTKPVPVPARKRRPLSAATRKRIRAVQKSAGLSGNKPTRRRWELLK